MQLVGGSLLTGLVQLADGPYTYPGILSEYFYAKLETERCDDLWSFLQNFVCNRYFVADNGYFQVIYFKDRAAYDTVFAALNP